MNDTISIKRQETDTGISLFLFLIFFFLFKGKDVSQILKIAAFPFPLLWQELPWLEPLTSQKV